MTGCVSVDEDESVIILDHDKRRIIIDIVNYKVKHITEDGIYKISTISRDGDISDMLKWLIG